MFKGHPKGLFILALSNMGERFGYYTMLAIFSLFLQDHYGMDETSAAGLYGIFLAGIYFLPLLGGIIADAGFGYGKTILSGLVVMFLGYVIMFFARNNINILYIALAVIALGVGFFKGNLVVIVGNLYEKSELGHLRDAAFSLFYMFINLGAFFAPYMANILKKFALSSSGYTYDSGLAKIAHDVLNNVATNQQIEKITTFAGNNDIHTFAQSYIDAISLGYSYGFLGAAGSMVISLLIFLGFRKYYKEADYVSKKTKATSAENELSPKQFWNRIIALVLVFVIVIFFWMAFHQNGSTLTFFAKNYTNLNATKFTYMFFNIETLCSILGVIIGIVLLFNKNKNFKITGGIVAAVCSFLVYYLYNHIDSTSLDPELFQSFNPIFVVFLSPLIVGFFTFLNKRSREPKAPMKIGIGMLITAIGFSLMLMASLGLPSVSELNGNAITINSAYDGLARSPYWLISTYFTLTIAELFLSPMGLSFVAKVAPPKIRGTMQAGWLAATAVGNYAAGYIGRFYKSWELWEFFLFIILVAILSAIIIFSLMRIIVRSSES